MKRTNIVSNIVLVGGFSPETFDKYFFVINEILKEDEILAGSFADKNIGVTQVNSARCQVVILPNQAVFTDLFPENNEDNIVHIVKKFVDALLQYDITAMGINFHWMLEDKSKVNSQFSRELFFSDQISLFKNFFSEDDCAYGAYASKNFENARLKLDVRPANAQNVKSGITTIYEGIDFQFNYHFNKDNVNTKEKAISNLDKYSTYRENSILILSIY